MLSVVALVALRLTIGWHFLYEGVWKVDNADQFSAMPFLTMAKGPFAQMFYAMSPDLDGELRLKPAHDMDELKKACEKEKIADPKEEKKKLDEPLTRVKWWAVKGFKSDVKKATEENPEPYVETTWELDEKDAHILVFPTYFDPVKDIFEFVSGEKGLVTPPKQTDEEKKAEAEAKKAEAEAKKAEAEKAAPADGEAKAAEEPAKTYGPYALSEDQMKELKRAWGRFVIDMDELYQADGETMVSYLKALKRLQDTTAGPNNGPEQKKRQWDEMMKLRVEANTYLNTMQSYCDTFVNEVKLLLNDEQKDAIKAGKKPAVPEFLVTTDRLPFGLDLPFVGQSWTEFLNFSVTWALTLIGACLILGFCSRLAAIGGGCFLLAVLMTQPPWPAIYPPFHPEVGHSMIVDKNFIEMVAVFALATLPVGRWGGLDFFLWNWFGKPLAKAFKLIPNEE